VRSAIAATTLLAATSLAAHARSSLAPTQEQSVPTQTSTVTDDAQQEDKPNEVSFFNGRFTLSPTKSLLESWLAGVDMKCVGCGAFDPNAVRPEPTNPNAPWLVGGKLRRQTPLGLFSTGFVGVRHYAMPLSTVTPISGEVDPGLLGVSSANYVGPSTLWSMTATFEKTLKTFESGASIGVTADVLIPVNAESAVGGDPLMSAIASRTIRAGIVIRW
jgi:hypothetical protein